MIENPIESDPGPLPTKPHPNFRPKAGQADGSRLSPLFRKLGLGQGSEPGRCGACGAIVKANESPCPKCGAPLTWEDEDVDPDLGI